MDLRTVSYEVPPQEMLSRDSVTVSVDAVCFYKVIFSSFILFSLRILHYYFFIIYKSHFVVCLLLNYILSYVKGMKILVMYRQLCLLHTL